MEERNSEVAPQGTNEAPNTFVFPPEGVVLKEEEMEEFELLKESHHLRPKDPSLAPAQFQSKPIVIECKICSKHFWSLQLTIDHVKNDDKHKKRYKARESEKKLREVSSIALTPEHIESLTRFVEQSYCENAAAVNEPVGLRSSVASEFKDFIGVELPDVSVEFFGSSVSELALKGSDVNINLDYEEKDEEIIYPRIPEVLRTAHKVLEAQSAIYGQIETDFYAYIPCIRCIHIKSNLKMNIRAGHHSSAVALSRLLGVYSKIDRRFQTLAVVFLCWAKRCELNDQESGYYCSSMFHTMVLYFLQQREKPILPVLHELSCSSEEEGLPPTSEESATLDRQYLDELPLLEEKWECQNSEPLGLLWFELLRLYTVQLKFPEVVVCVRQSAVMQRNKDWPGNRLAIEHPFMKKYDLGKAVASQPAQDYLKSCLREALVYFGHLELPPVKSPKGGQRPPKQEEAMVVQNLEECSTKADQEAVDSVTGGTDTSHLAQSMKGKMDVFLSLSFIESTPSKKKRPVACYKCKQDGHIAKRCTNDCTKDLIDFGDVCSVSEEMREAIQGLMESYLDQRGLNEFGYKLRRRLRDEILADILLVYPTAKLEIFGSSGNGFGTLDSDLDLCMMLEGVTTPEEKAKVIEVLFGMMKNNPGRKYNKLIPITNARVPIIKFIYRCKEMKHVECDISLGNYLAVHNTKMLGAYSRIDHRVRVLGHTLKCLMKNCGVADASQGSLSSYAYILMVVHYLQRTSPPVLPVLQKLYPPGSDTKERLVGKWNCYFYDFQDPSELASLWPGLGKNKENVVNLFVGMLRYYSVDFDWKHKVVSIRLEPECILDKFDKMWIGKVACVEDPFDLSHNLGTVVSQRMFKFVHSVLMNTAGYLLGKGKCSKPLTLDTLGRTRNLERLFDPKLLMADKRAPVDPKYWDRINRGEEVTDNPPKKKPKRSDGKDKGREKTPKGGSKPPPKQEFHLPAQQIGDPPHSSQHGMVPIPSMQFTNQMLPLYPPQAPVSPQASYGHPLVPTPPSVHNVGFSPTVSPGVSPYGISTYGRPPLLQTPPGSQNIPYYQPGPGPNYPLNISHYSSPMEDIIAPLTKETVDKHAQQLRKEHIPTPTSPKDMSLDSSAARFVTNNSTVNKASSESTSTNDYRKQVHKDTATVKILPRDRKPKVQTSSASHHHSATVSTGVQHPERSRPNSSKHHGSSPSTHDSRQVSSVPSPETDSKRGNHGKRGRGPYRSRGRGRGRGKPQDSKRPGLPRDGQ